MVTTPSVVPDGRTPTYSYAACVDIGALVASVGLDSAGQPVFVRGGDCRSRCKEAFGGNWTPAWQDPPANLPDRIMDASRGAHVVVRLELVGRLNNDRRRLN